MTDCSKIPTLTLVEDSKKAMDSLNQYWSSTEDTIVDPFGVARKTAKAIDDIFNEAEADAISATQSANAAEAAASSAGYKGLWPDTGGLAEKGDTWQTQIGGTPTGEYYTALQNTSVDPVGDNVNWRLTSKKDGKYGSVQIVFEGDSITEGNTIGGFKYSEWLESLSYSTKNGMTTSNFAVGGAVISGTGGNGDPNNNLNYRYPIDVFPLRPSSNGGTGSEQVFLHVLIGVNDLNPAYGNKSSATVISELTSYVNLAKSDGFTVVVGTILPVSVGNWTYDVDVKRAEVNTAIRTKVIPADFVIDYAQLLTDSDDLYVFKDKIHPTVNGAKLIANHINDLLENGLEAQPNHVGDKLHNPTMRGRVKLEDDSFFEVGTAFQKLSIGSNNNNSTGFLIFEDLNDTRVDTKKWQVASGINNKLQIQALNDANSAASDIMTLERDGLNTGCKVSFYGRVVTGNSSAFFEAGTAFNKIYLGSFNGSGAGFLISENLQGSGGVNRKYLEMIQDANDTFRINLVNDAVNDNNVAMRIYRNGYTPTSVNFGTNVSPEVDNSYALGGVTNRWSQVFAVDGTINTSDEREKTFLDITEAERKTAIEIKSNMRKFKWNHSVDKKGEDDARIHFGVSAQQVEEIFNKNGLDARNYGLFCYDEWDDEFERVQNESGEIESKLVTASGNRFGIRYDELLCFIMSAI